MAHVPLPADGGPAWDAGHLAVATALTLNPVLAVIGYSTSCLGGGGRYSGRTWSGSTALGGYANLAI